MNKIILVITLVVIGSVTLPAQVHRLVDFNNTSDLTTNFNPDSSPEFTNISSGGIGNTGSIDVPIPSNDIWTTRVGYSVSGAGDVYTLSAYFQIEENSGYGGLGLSASDVNEGNYAGAPEFGLGMAFHGGGGMFENNQEETSVDWPPDLVLGNWYKMILKVTAKGGDLFDLNFQIWNSDASGTLGSMKTEQALTNVSNSDVGGASTLHVYFSAAGSRMAKIDNFDITLEGGAVFIEEGAPVVLTDAVSAITATTATCGGNVTDDRGLTVTSRGVCWNTSQEPTTALSTKTSDGTGTGTFSSSLTNLVPSTTYYVRSYAINSEGTSYGAEESFVTAFGAVLPAGAGTSGSPYLIATLNNLYWIAAPGTVDGLTQAQRWAAHYKQTANIDASGTSAWDGGQGWAPIGTNVTPFQGTYSGQSFFIDGVFINRPATDNVGFLGYANGSTISDLGLTNTNITAHNNVGGLAGYSIGTTAISNCYSTGSIVGHQYVGGLMGTKNGTMVKSFSTCSIAGNAASSGGLVGNNYDAVTNCYSTGNSAAISSIDVGGFIGLNWGDVSCCYSTGSVDISKGSTLGFVGTSAYSATYSANFFDQTTSGQTSGTGATAETTPQMKTNATFLSAGWDPLFWYRDIGINNGYLYLYWQNPGGSPLPIQLASFTAIVLAPSHVRLAWATLTEINNYGFEVQKSNTTQHQYQAIPNSFVPGHGTTNEPQQYNYMDTTATAGAWYYRLKQMDLDGTVHFSDGIRVASLTGVDGQDIPGAFVLSQNYPNPFNPSTSIRYAVPQSSFVTLTIYNMLGQQVAKLVNEQQQAGYHDVVFRGEGCASGVYFYRLQAGTFSQTRKLVLTR